jgi:hypothetical protein
MTIVDTAFSDSYIKAGPSPKSSKFRVMPASMITLLVSSLRELKIDAELAYAYAKTDRLHDIEDFLGMTNVADIREV